MFQNTYTMEETIYDLCQSEENLSFIETFEQLQKHTTSEKIRMLTKIQEDYKDISCSKPIKQSFESFINNQSSEAAGAAVGGVVGKLVGAGAQGGIAAAIFAVKKFVGLVVKFFIGIIILFVKAVGFVFKSIKKSFETKSKAKKYDKMMAKQNKSKEDFSHSLEAEGQEEDDGSNVLNKKYSLLPLNIETFNPSAFIRTLDFYDKIADSLTRFASKTDQPKAHAAEIERSLTELYKLIGYTQVIELTEDMDKYTSDAKEREKYLRIDGLDKGLMFIEKLFGFKKAENYSDPNAYENMVRTRGFFFEEPLKKLYDIESRYRSRYEKSMKTINTTLDRLSANKGEQEKQTGNQKVISEQIKVLVRYQRTVGEVLQKVNGHFLAMSKIVAGPPKTKKEEKK